MLLEKKDELTYVNYHQYAIQNTRSLLFSLLTEFDEL